MLLFQTLTKFNSNIANKCPAHSSLTRRFLALLIDLFICKIAAFLLIILLSYINIMNINNPLSYLYSFKNELNLWKITDLFLVLLNFDNLKYLLIFFLTFTSYSTIFKISKTKSTIGQSIFKIIVVNHDGSSLNIKQALIRSSLIFISFLILPLGIISFLKALYSKERISLHDELCDTRVVNFH